MHRILTLSLVIAAGTVGCGQNADEPATQDAAETAAITDEQTVEAVDEAGGPSDPVAVSPDQDDRVVGDEAELPDDFPEDVPVYEGFTPDMVTSLSQNNVFNIGGPVEASLDDIKAFYAEKAAAEGWTETMAMSQGQMLMLHYEKDKRVFQVTATSGDPTRLTITTAETE